MTNTSLTGLATTFIVLTFIFAGFSLAYSFANINGFDTTGIDNSLFNEIGNQTKSEEYLTSLGNSTDANTKGDSGAFDVIGTLINTALTPFRLLKDGAIFLVTNIGTMISYLGVPKIVGDLIAAILTLIVLSITIFAVVLGRRDKID